LEDGAGDVRSRVKAPEKYHARLGIVARLTLILAALLAVFAAFPLLSHVAPREFSVREAGFAASLSAEADGRPDPAATEATRPLLRALRASSALVGLTERPLRALILLAAALGSLVGAMALARVAGPAAAWIFAALAAASPFLEADLLDPMLFGFAAGGLLLGVLPLLASGSPAWAFPLAAGGLLAAAGDPRGALAVLIAAAILLAARAPWRRRLSAALVLAGSVLAGLALSARGLRFPAAPGIPVDGPGLLALSGTGPSEGAALAVLASATLLLGLLGRHPGLRFAALGVAAALAAFVAAAPRGAEAFSGTGFSLFALPAAALVAAASASVPARLGPLLPLLLAAALVLDRWPEAWRLAAAELGGGVRHERPLQERLETVRGLVEPGGRVLLLGEDRFALLHYAGRGLDPGAPILLIPEDLRLADLGAELRSRLGVDPGISDRAPAVWVWPAWSDAVDGIRLEPGPGGWHRLRMSAPVK
jgi:hypothetical protein